MSQISPYHFYNHHKADQPLFHLLFFIVSLDGFGSLLYDLRPFFN